MLAATGYPLVGYRPPGAPILMGKTPEALAPQGLTPRDCTRSAGAWGVGSQPG